MPGSVQLLVVSPDAPLGQVIHDYATSLGHGVFLAAGLAEARRVITRVRVDLICLDSLLPPADVERFCSVVVSPDGARPFVVFIAPSSMKLVPSALPACFRPDRYGVVTKPLDIDELEREMARLLAADRPREAALLHAGSIALDGSTRQLLFASGGALTLTPTEYRLLRYLMERPGEFVSPDELLEKAWGYPKDTGGAEVVRAHISNVRRKLRSAGQDPQLLRNIPYQGYAISVETRNGGRGGRAGHSK